MTEPKTDRATMELAASFKRLESMTDEDLLALHETIRKEAVAALENMTELLKAGEYEKAALIPEYSSPGSALDGGNNRYIPLNLPVAYPSYKPDIGTATTYLARITEVLDSRSVGVPGWNKQPEPKVEPKQPSAFLLEKVCEILSGTLDGVSTWPEDFDRDDFRAEMADLGYGVEFNIANDLMALYPGQYRKVEKPEEEKAPRTQY